MGVSPHATQVQIKEAYYRLSMKYHPDRNKGSDDAHQKFTELTDAYSILGQYDLRRKYDKGMLHEYRRPPSHTHSDHATHHSGTSSAAHHSSAARARGGPSTVHGKKSRFDFDEFYRAHYGEALRREQEARRKRAAAKEMAKLRSVSDSWHRLLIVWVCVSVMLVGWYGYSWRRGIAPNRTKTSNNLG
jgi:DnaJ family protein C protein 30